MKNKRKNTKYPGVYTLELSHKKHLGEPDIAYQISFKDKNGKKVWRNAGYKSDGTTPILASHKRAEYMSDSTSLADSRITLGFVWKKLWENKIRLNRSAHDYQQRWNTHIAHLKNKPLADITRDDLQSLLNSKINAGLAPQTIKHIFAIIKQIYNYANALDIYNGRCPAAIITMPRINNKRYRYLTPEETKKLMDNLRTRSITLYEISLVALLTGLRAGEIFNLTGDRVSLEHRLIVATDTKSGKDKVIPMPDSLFDIFKTKDLSPGEFVFKSRTGARIKEVSRSFDRAIDNLGFNTGITDRRGKVVFYTLRHTFASWLTTHDTDLNLIAELLGHSSIEMTRRYAHLSPAAKKAGTDIVNNIYANAASLH